MSSENDTQPEDDIVQETQEDLMARLVSNQLKQAERAMEQNKLNEAAEFFKKALQVPGRRPERDADIRQILHQYSANYAKARPEPHWDLAHKTLNLLNDLGLANNESQEWRRELHLEEARFKLQQQDFGQSVATFASLLQEADPSTKQPLKHKITIIGREYITQHTAVNDWPLLHKLIKDFQPLEASLPDLHEWLKTIAKLLTAAEEQQQEHQERFQSMDQALAERKEVVSQQRQEINQLTTQLKQQKDAKQRYQLYNRLLLAGIIITLAVAYCSVIFIL